MTIRSVRQTTSRAFTPEQASAWAEQILARDGIVVSGWELVPGGSWRSLDEYRDGPYELTPTPNAAGWTLHTTHP